MTRALPRRASRRARPADRSRSACRHPRLGVHAVIGGQRRSRSRCASSLPGSRPSSRRRRWRLGAGRVLVLDVVGGRQIHQVGPARLRISRRRPRIRILTARRCRHPAPACRPARARRRCRFPSTVALSAFSAEKQMPLHAVAEQLAQFVFRGDHGDRCAGVGERGQQGRRAQTLRVVHHHFGARWRRRTGSCRRCRAPKAARR